VTVLTSEQPAPPRSRTSRALRQFEDGLAAFALAAMVFIPLLEIVLRRLAGVGVPGAGPIVQHLVLWVGFLGAAIAAREGRLLSLATGGFVPEGAPRRAATIFTAAVASAAAILLASGAIDLIRSEREAGTILGAGIPTWVAQLVLPVGFILIAVRLVWRSSNTWAGRAIASSGIAVGVLLARMPTLIEGGPAWPGLTLVFLAAALGAPIFAILGGAAVVLFMTDGITPAAILIETYSLSVSPTLPAIPLFTLAGFILAEGHASTRLLRVFRAWFGWIPGGSAVVCAVLCSFFTAFTGGSGVTILALGGVLLPALIKDGYRERFALGLLTASGSLGLLLPPSLPLILYGVVAQIPIEDLFIGGIVPGVLLTAMMAAYGMREGAVSGAGRQRFEWREALAAVWAAKWELALPIVVLVSMFSGIATTVEASALTGCFALFTQAMIHRDLSIRRDLLRVFAECVGLIGGVLVILGVAVGLTNWLVDAQVPTRLVEFTQAHIGSRFVFLLALNVFLLLVGCLMEIFPAIVVVVPLIVPLGAAFEVHPVHLGIIFIANLELGYLTPLVGLNILLASYRFKRPVLEVARAALPMGAILAIGVLVITYVPWLTLGLLRMLGRS
jgi:tripartite ATP-independent transporter DctM subunit